MVDLIFNFLILGVGEEETVQLLAEPTRTVALMALLGIALLGLLMIVSIMLGASWVRRIGDFRRGPVVPPDVMTSPKRSTTVRLPSSEPDAGDTLGSDETLAN